MTPQKEVPEPSERYTTNTSQSGFVSPTYKRNARTFVEALRNDKVAFRMPHLHVFLVLAQFVDALLCELHDEHVYRDARDRIVLRLHIRVTPARREFLILAFPRCKLARVRQRL